MHFDKADNNPSTTIKADYYYQQWQQLKEIGREVYDRGNKKVRLGHPIICDLAKMLNLYEPINQAAYHRMQQRTKEADTLDAKWIYDWISEEKSALKIKQGIVDKSAMVE